MEAAAGGAGRSRCSTRATRSTPTRPGRPRTPRPRRSGSSTRRPTPSATRAPSSELRMDCVLEGERRRAAGRGALPAGPRASATRRCRGGSSSTSPGDGEFECGAAARARALLSRATAAARVLRRGEPTRRSPIRTPTGPRRCGTRCSPPTWCCAATRAASSRRSRSPGDNINSWPVLATRRRRRGAGRGDRAARPSRSWPARASGSLFDGTEIEEALLLHVQALSDGERESIAEQDPAVREMIERAAAATPEDLFRLHGRDAAHASRRTSRASPRSTVDGRDLHRAAARWCCAWARGATRTTRMLDGRLATIERIYIDYDDAVHLARDRRRRPRAAT